jgi:hypothetical protein
MGILELESALSKDYFKWREAAKLNSISCLVKFRRKIQEMVLRNATSSPSSFGPGFIPLLLGGDGLKKEGWGEGGWGDGGLSSTVWLP